MAVTITLCDRSADMVRAWRSYFAEESGVKVLSQNILTVPAAALVVPANAFGFTDGGVDLAISREIFDWGLQDRLRQVIEAEHAGELLVGEALVMATGSARLRHVVVAPTMRVPEDVGATVNAFLALRGVLLTIRRHNAAAKKAEDRIDSVAVPGLATGVGKMSPERSAYQMWMAYRTVILGDTEWSRSLEKQAAMHRKMRDR